MRALLVLLACGAICYGGPVILRLGFYHDDWTFLSVLHFADGGLFGHMAALVRDLPAIVMRPTNIPLFVLAHRFFGLNPLPWQLLLFASNVLLAYLLQAVVVRYGAPRRIALAAAALYLAYPSKDATMFWPGAVICSLSLAAFLGAYLSHLEHVRAGSVSRRALAAALLLYSLTAYELVLFMIPLFLLAPDSASPEAAARKRRGFVDASVVLGALLAYKFLLAPRFSGVGVVKRPSLSLVHFVWAYLAAGNAAAGPKLVRYTAAAAWKTCFAAPWLAAASAAVGALLAKIESGEKPASNENRRRLLALGAGFALLGCLPLALSDYTPTPLNHQNRINQALLLGPVLMLAAHLAGARARKAELAALAVLVVSLSAHAGFASVWAESYRRQLGLRDVLLARRDDWPAEAMLLVLLPERYVDSKAPVFDAHWDVTGAVQIWTGDANRHAMTVRPGLVSACSAAGVTLAGTLRPLTSLRLLDARTGRLAAPRESDCAELLSPP